MIREESEQDLRSEEGMYDLDSIRGLSPSLPKFPKNL